MHAIKTQAQPSLFWLASTLFFVSGGTGLAYQVVWFKRFSHVWGSSSLAFAAVGGSFLLGLGLGAYLFGRVTDRLTAPLRWYGVCELLIGTLALVIPFEIAGLVDASVSLYSAIPQQPLLRFFVQCAITLIVIGPPCALMGGTLPLLIRQLTARDGALDQATGWLYAINTFGAAVGCYLTGFHLLPSFGLLWTNNMAAAINISIGVISVMASLGTTRPQMTRKVNPSADRLPSAGWQLARLYVATAMTGCAALVLEMTWTRQLALILGGSTYAFTATLFVVLVGIALGSLIFHAGLRRLTNNANVIVAVITLLIVTALVGKLAIPTLSVAVSPEDVRQKRSEQFYNGALCVGVSAALEFVPAVAMGLLFPLFVSLTRASAEGVGAAVGNIYAWNTTGSIAGATLTAILLFPRIGTTGAMGVAVALYGVALLLVLPWRSRLDVVRGLGAAVAAAAVAAFIARPIDPRLTNAGFYIYGEPAVAYGVGDWINKLKPRFFREGASSNVFVNSVAPGTISLRVNGKVDASNGADMVTQLGLAYFPRLFNHDAKDVLVIGFGSGCTSGSSLLFPGTRVTCCEIEPAVYQATEEFAEYNHRPQEKSRSWIGAHNAVLPESQRMSDEQIIAASRFSIVFGDGRTAIQGATRKYDLIISEPSNPWLAGVSNLFTQEFFRSAREALNDDGVLAQWIQTYNFTLSDYLMIVRTLRSEFPHFGAILLANGLDTILLASKHPLMPAAQDLASLQGLVDRVPELRADLKKYFSTTDVRHLLVLNYQLGEEQLDRLVRRDKSQDLNTDLHLRLEFDAPLHLFSRLTPHDSATIGLLSEVDTKWTERLAAVTGLGVDSAEFHLLLAERNFSRAMNPVTQNVSKKDRELELTLSELQKCLSIDSDVGDAYRLLARTYETQLRWADAAAAQKKFLQIMRDDPSARAELAQMFLKLKDPAQAIANFQIALRLQGDVSVKSGSFMWANNLAWLLATSPDDKVRNGMEAVDWAKQACKADGYQNPALLDTLAAALAEVGQFDEAVKVSEQLIDLAKGQESVIASARERIELYRSSRPFREQ